MKNGATPVHLAAQCGHVEVVRHHSTEFHVFNVDLRIFGRV